MRVIPFALTIFLSAFLLFQVQPLIGRFILPWFGGSAGVWSVTMLFFQAMLLAGYGYAHLLARRLPIKAQAAVHVGVLIVCALLLPITPPEALKPAPGAEPIVGILGLLAASVGAPYFALATTGPLLQSWFARAVPGRSPYPLYALSNVGSLLALVSYPFVVEPLLGRSMQAAVWSWSFGAFAVLCAGAAVLAALVSAPAPEAAAAPQSRPARGDITTWIALPAVASALLLAITNELCIDVASVPFLWVLPLSIYLVSFIVTFSFRTAPRRGLWFPLACLAIAGIATAMYYSHSMSIMAMVGIHSAGLLILCVVLHGEAYRTRPEASGLTAFYLCVSLGGVLGGLFVAVVAPLVFPLHLELHLLLLAIALLLARALWRDPGTPLHRGGMGPAWGAMAAMLVTLLVALISDVHGRLEDRVLVTRNFYGTYSVYEPPQDSDTEWYRSLRSGTTLHGMQYMDAAYRRTPTTYYGRFSGVALAIESLPLAPRRIGVVGLGVGTMAAFGRAGDSVTFYEINPQSVDVARDWFFYVSDSQAEVSTVLGDARLSLEYQPPQQFDLLALDAFTSDSIPVHLLTIEAMELYFRHLTPSGVLCVHVSNRHLDLEPVLRAAALHMGLRHWSVSSDQVPHIGTEAAVWVILTRAETFKPVFVATMEAVLADHALEGTGLAVLSDMAHEKEIPMWTDDYSNLFRVLR